MDNPDKIKELSFEQAMTALEAIVERLSSSQPELDEMLRLYEEGTLYLSHCRGKLQDAEAKILIIGQDIKVNPQVEE